MAGVPPHKVIPGTSFTVDGFRHAQPWVKAYFLSHAHSDHYTGLNENWSAGPIYCSPITAALAEHLAGVPAQYLHALQLDTPHVIEGVTVILVDANHCPGAVQLLFELPDGSKYIHCGDMRYSRQMQDNPHLARFRGANAVFLDTTYCKPRHTFPAQEAAVDFVASRIQQYLQEDEQAGAVDSYTAEAADNAALPSTAALGDTTGPEGEESLESDLQPESEPTPPGQQPAQERQLTEQQQQQQQYGEDEPDSQVTAGEQLGFRRLYLISTYVIGKERLLLAVSRKTGKRLLVTHRKLQVLRRIGLSESELSSCFTQEPRETPIHVLRWGVLGDAWPYFRPNFTNMQKAMTQTGAQEVVGFVPTGWLHEMRKAAAKGTFPSRHKGSCTVWLIPYSEHSSFVELKEYVAWLKPKQVIPTVNVGEPGAAGDRQRNSMLQHFRGLLDETSNKAAFLARMAAAASTANTVAVVAVAKQASGDIGGAVSEADNAEGDAVGAEAPAGDADTTVLDTGGNGFWDCVHDSEPTARALSAQLPAEGIIGQGQTPAATAAGEAATTATTAAATAAVAAAATAGAVEAEGDSSGKSPALSEVAGDASIEGDASVQLLLAVAGPDSQLSATEAQQFLAAAGGDVNAAMNALLDASNKRSQHTASATDTAPAGGAASSGGSKRQQQQQQQKSVSGDTRKGSKKQSSKQAASSAGQSAITAFFGPRGTTQPVRQQIKQQKAELPTTPQPQRDRKTQQQQQQQQQTVTQHRGRSVSPEALVVSPAAAAGMGVANPPRIVLPSLKRKSASPSPTAAAHAAVAAIRAQTDTSNLHPELAVSGQQSIQYDVSESKQHQPAAEAGSTGGAADLAETKQGTCTTVLEGQGVDSRPVVAAEAPAGPTEQQQQQSAKESWAAVFPGALSSPAKRRKVAAAAADAPAKPHAAAAAAAGHSTDAPLTAAAAAAAGPEAGSHAPTMLGASSSGSSSITKAMRDAPLLPLARYNPLTDACWSAGEPAPYLALGLTLSAVDGTTKRLKIADGLTNLFRSLMLLAPQDVTAAAYLICGKIAPEYTAGCELNVGGSVVSSALCEVCGVSRNQLRDMYAQHGDLGDVAQACRRKQTSLLQPPPLTISGVFNTLHTLAAQSGQGASGRRQSTIAKLLRCCRDVETKYLVRTLIQNLRVGAGWKSVLGPMAKAALLHRKMLEAAGLLQQQHQQQQVENEQQDRHKQAAAVQPAALDSAATSAAAAHAASSAAKVSKQQLEAAAAAAAAAYHTCPNLGIIVDVLMTHGPEGLATRVHLTPGVPVKPMLAKPCTGTADALQQLATTAAVAAAGGKRVGRGAAGKKPTALAQPAAVAAAAAAAHSSDVDDDDDDVVMLDEHSADSDAEMDTDAAVANAAAVDAELVSAADDSTALPVTDVAVNGGTEVAAALPGGLAILAEYKYDGQRAQIHVAADGQVHIFSRNCEDRTHSFPDVAAAIVAAADPAALPLVLDTELAAVDRADGNRIRAFQELASRPRGSAAAAGAAAGSSTARAAAAAEAATGGAGQKAAKQQQQKPQQKQQKLELAPAAPTGDLPSPVRQSEPLPLPQQQSHESGIDICIFAFDALCIGGKDLMGLSLRERRAALVAALPGAQPGVVQLAEGVEIQVDDTVAAAAVAEGGVAGATAAAGSADSTAAAEGVMSAAEQSVTDFFFKALAAGTEGLMIKLLDGPGSVYQPARRGLSWLKLKRDYLEGLADSIDLVPIGAWQGQGRKVKWYSPFLLAVYDPATETFQSLCRCMSGFTDEFYAAATARLGATVIPGPKPYYETFERPDVWFEPTEVWEIRGADISISPVHRAAAGRLHADRGLGLRFPRFMRIRDDKRPEEASGPDLIVDLYNKQTRRVVNK